MKHAATLQQRLGTQGQTLVVEHLFRTSKSTIRKEIYISRQVEYRSPRELRLEHYGEQSHYTFPGNEAKLVRHNTLSRRGLGILWAYAMESTQSF